MSIMDEQLEKATAGPWGRRTATVGAGAEAKEVRCAGIMASGAKPTTQNPRPRRTGAKLTGAAQAPKLASA